MTHSTSVDVEPTPEFNAAILDVIHRWERGELPFSQTIQELTGMLREAAASRHIANQGRAYHLLGYAQHYNGNLGTSIMYYEKSRRLYLRAGNERRAATIDLNQGENYRNKGEFSRARRLYRRCYETARELDDIRLMAMAIINEGLTLISLHDYETAETALHEGYRLLESMPEEPDNLPYILTELHHGLATIALDHEDISLAHEQARHALHYAQLAGKPISLGYAYRILGDVFTYDVAGDSENPDEFYRAALDAFREVNAEGEAGRTLYAHATSLAKRHKRRGAARLYREAMVIFTRLGMTHDAARAAEAQLRVL